MNNKLTIFIHQIDSNNVALSPFVDLIREIPESVSENIADWVFFNLIYWTRDGDSILLNRRDVRGCLINHSDFS